MAISGRDSNSLAWHSQTKGNITMQYQARCSSGQKRSCRSSEIINGQEPRLYAYRVRKGLQYHLSAENFVQELVAHKKDFRVHVRIAADATTAPHRRPATEDYRSTNGSDKRCETEHGLKGKRAFMT